MSNDSIALSMILLLLIMCVSLSQVPLMPSQWVMDNLVLLPKVRDRNDSMLILNCVFENIL